MKHLIFCLPLDWMRMDWSIHIQINGRQHIRCFIPQAVFYSLMLLKMGIIIARNMSSYLWNFNKLPSPSASKPTAGNT